MNYCSDCGARVRLQVVGGDNRRRFVCQGCGTAHYRNPNVLVAVYVCVGERILWIRRGIAPAIGKWAIPGGFMENDETPEAAVSRELREETGLSVAPDDMVLVSVSSILHMAQTHLVFRCHLERQPQTTRTPEATEFGWFTQGEMPWPDLAFVRIEPQIRQMYRWLKSGAYCIRIGFVDEDGSHYKHFRLARK